MNENFTELIHNVKQAMFQDVEHNIAPKYRAELYDMLQKANPKAYYYLITLTLEYVLPLCQDRELLENLPQIVLNLIKDALKGEVSQTVLEDMLTRIWPLVDKSGDDDSGVSLASFFVLCTAYQALAETSGIVPFEDHDIYNIEDEDDVEIGSSDTARFAANAYAGRIGFPQDDPLKRQLFWQWWLEKAIPEAYNLAQE